MTRRGQIWQFIYKMQPGPCVILAGSRASSIYFVMSVGDVEGSQPVMHGDACSGRLLSAASHAECPC